MDWFNAISAPLLWIVLPALATALAGLGIGILTRQLKKLGLELTEAQQARLKQIAADAIKAVEEQARRTPISSAEKSTIAADIVRVQRPDIGTADLRLLLDTALTEARPTFVPLTPRTFGGPKAGVEKKP